MHVGTPIVLLLLLVAGCSSSDEVASRSGCSDVHFAVVQRGGPPVVAVSASECRDADGVLLPAGAAVDRLAAAAWVTELPRFDRIDIVVYRVAETASVVRATIRSFSRPELEGRWGARAAALDGEAPRGGPSGPWLLLPIAAVLVLAMGVGAGVRAAGSGSVVVVWSPGR